MQPRPTLNHDRKSVPVILINGFLGAGKTTLVQHLMDQLPEERIGLLENEFGEIGIDTLRISRDHEKLQIIEVNNGSIFCSCRHEEFLEAMHLLAQTPTPLDLLFIECSGIADPAPMERDLELLTAQLGEVYHHLGNLCVVDAPHFLELLEMLEVLAKQIEFSQIILVNKADLVSQETLEAISTRIQQLNPQAHIIHTTYCKIQFTVIREDFKMIALPEPDESVNTPQSSPQKLVLTTPKPFLKTDLLEFLQHFATDTFRIKGFCQLKEGGTSRWYYLDSVKAIISFMPVDRAQKCEKTEIVVILRNGDPLGEIIREAWNHQFN